MNAGRILLVISVLPAFGCGGSRSWGVNSKFEVRAITGRADDLDLIVSPRERPAESTSACGREFSNFGCDRDFDDDALSIEFHSNSRASKEPFYVYLRSRHGKRVRAVDLEFYVDNELKETGSVDVDVDETVRIARVFRNSVNLD